MTTPPLGSDKECEHKWKEDEMFASGAVMMFGGGVSDVGQETRVICENCGAVDYTPKDYLNRINLLDS